MGDANFENSLEAAAAAVVVCDPAGVIRFVNRKAESLFGYCRDDLAGQGIEMLVPESSREVDAALHAECFADPCFRPSGLGLERTGRRRDGTEFPVDFSVAHLETEDGPLALATVRDLKGLKTQDKQAAGDECSDVATYEWTIEGIVTSWSAAAEQHFGYSSEEIIGRSVMLLVPEDRVGEMAAILGKISAGLATEHYESRRLRKCGTTFPVSLNISPVKDSLGVVVGASSIVRDLGDRRKAGSRRNPDQVSPLVESIGEAIASSTPEGIITCWNPAAERLLGYTSGEMIGTSASRLIPPDLASEIDQVLARVKSIRSPRSIENMLVRKDGTLAPVAMTLAPILDADGTIVGVSSVAYDVTCRRTTEQELHQQAVLLESANAAVSGETDAIVGITLEGIVTSWNLGAEKIFGYSRKEMIGESVLILSPKNQLDDAAAIVAKAVEGLAIERYESARVRRDGTTFPASLTISPILDANDGVIGVCGIVRDLTAQRRDQREIAEWRDKAFKWMEDLEQSQRLAVMRDFEHELKVIDLQQEVERLRRRAAQDPRDAGDEP
ncbi:MAG: PAS domain S-box protein [Phycicoccus sp.]|nr:PAS domain S-box protein [Phycicoccus sp.]